MFSAKSSLRGRRPFAKTLKLVVWAFSLNFLHDSTLFVIDIHQNMPISLISTPFDSFQVRPTFAVTPNLILEPCLILTSTRNPWALNSIIHSQSLFKYYQRDIRAAFFIWAHESLFLSAVLWQKLIFVQKCNPGLNAFFYQIFKIITCLLRFTLVAPIFKIQRCFEQGMKAHFEEWKWVLRNQQLIFGNKKMCRTPEEWMFVYPAFML